MQTVKALNLALRFALELGAIAALAYWGIQTGDGTLTSMALSIAAPVLMIVVWGAVVAPRSKFSLPKLAKWVVGLGILLLAAAALRDAGNDTVALVFGVVAIINAALMAVWHQ